MKICFIVGAFPTMKCGVGDYCNKLSEELAKQGHEIHVITSKLAKCENNLMHIYNIVEDWGFSSIKIILKKLKEISPDVVNIQYPSDEYKDRISMNILPIKIKQKLKCKVTATFHEYECYTWKRKIRYNFNFKKLDNLITVEEDFKTEIENKFKNVKVSYIPISSSIPRSKITEEEKQELIKKYNLKDTKVISYFGFVNHLKGLESLFECVSKLDNIKLLIINELEDKNDYHKSLKELIKKLDIENKIVITGFVDKEEDVANLLQISDICVLPFTNGVKSRNSSFLAAYNQDIPIITTSNELKDNNGIYYVKPKQEDELLEKIKYVLNNKEEFTRDILTWENVAKSYIEKFK